MRKRVKLSIPKLIKEILDKDIEYFNIKLEKLCNIIVQEMGYEPVLRIQDKLKNERKIPITFNLNERNTKFLQDMIKCSPEKLETEFFRSLFSTYCNLHPSLREKVVKKNLYLEIEISIKEKLPIKVSYNNKVIDILPITFLRDILTDYNSLECTNEESKETMVLQLKNIEILNTNL
ncbi:MAG: hypothetical protein ACRCX8_00220 [Sarcina sp.]